MLIRFATVGDRNQIREFLVGYLDEMAVAGGEIVPNDHNLNVYLGRFDEYIETPHSGVVTICPIGFFMAGDPNMALETVWGRIAVGWGTYVYPGGRNRGVSKALREKGIDHLRDNGFAAVIGTVHIGNELGAKSMANLPFEPYAIQGVRLI